MPYHESRYLRQARFPGNQYVDLSRIITLTTPSELFNSNMYGQKCQTVVRKVSEMSNDRLHTLKLQNDMIYCPRRNHLPDVWEGGMMAKTREENRMNYQEVLTKARKTIGNYCKACNVCNGRACGNQMPGPGAKGLGDTAIRNFDAWQKVRINMDTLCENRKVDTSVELFGKKFRMPVFAGPVGAVKLHYGDCYDDLSYNSILLAGCEESGIAAFTGDGTNEQVMIGATEAIRQAGGMGVPTVKPWSKEVIDEKMKLVKASGAFAVAMDIDAAGLPFLKNCEPPAGSKSEAELKEIISAHDVPFIVKGIITVKGALKAKEAGAAAIVVSNHGGRVLDQCPSTAEVLPEIAEALKGSGVKILVDGGIRSGVTVFKALAMGADGVLIARPFVTAVYGGAKEGVSAYVDQIAGELEDTMAMCGAASVDEITSDMVRLPQVW